MDYLLFFSFLTATLLIIATPGPSVALASSQAIRFGPKAALTTVAGDALGSAVHILIAVGSLQTLIAWSEVILPYLQIAGGLFILWMAVQALRSTPQDPATVQGTATRATFFAGFFACVTNPKAIVFFVALFPGFISPEHSIVTQSLIYGAIFISLDALSILGYALLAMHTFRRSLASRISIEKLSGYGLIGVAAALIAKGYSALPAK